MLAAAQLAKDNTRTVGFALTPCVIPEIGHPNFTPGGERDGHGHGHPRGAGRVERPGEDRRT